MPVVRFRNRVEILRDLVARVVARSTLTGLVRNGAVYHVLAGAAEEAHEIYVQLAQLRQVFSIDTATGSDLDERAREIQPAIISREQALYATGLQTFSRSGTSGTLAIPAGTIVAGSDGAGPIRFKTTASGSITPGNTISSPIPITALEAGARGNVAANNIVSLVTRLPGVIATSNPSALQNGRNRESDQSFRARLKAYIRSLGRGTRQTLETVVLGTRLPDGAKIVFAKVIRNPFATGDVEIYVDDSTGSIETYDSQYIGTYDVLLNPALGGERRIFTTRKPIRDDGSFVVERNGVALVRNTDYVLDTAIGQIALTTTSFPTGLTAGDVIRAHYRFYTRLIQEAQRIVDGDALDPLNYPGYKAGGDYVRVLPPQTVPQTIDAGIAVDNGFDTLTVAQAVATAIQNYINGLNIGDDVIVAKIIEVAMDVEGMRDFRMTNLSGTSPPVNQVLLDNQVARIRASDISLI